VVIATQPTSYQHPFLLKFDSHHYAGQDYSVGQQNRPLRTTSLQVEFRPNKLFPDVFDPVDVLSSNLTRFSA
jgi:hypothetical protein